MSKSEEVLQAILALLQTLPGITVYRNQDRDKRIPDGGLVVLRDGDPGEPEVTLGGSSGVYYSHLVQIEVHVQNADASTRETVFDDLLVAVGEVLEADPTLGGVAHGLLLRRPSVRMTAVEGAGAIKTGIIPVTVDYFSPGMLG